MCLLIIPEIEETTTTTTATTTTTTTTTTSPTTEILGSSLASELKYPFLNAFGYKNKLESSTSTVVSSAQLNNGEASSDYYYDDVEDSCEFCRQKSDRVTFKEFCKNDHGIFIFCLFFLLIYTKVDRPHKNTQFFLNNYFIKLKIKKS